MIHDQPVNGLALTKQGCYLNVIFAYKLPTRLFAVNVAPFLTRPRNYRSVMGAVYNTAMS